MFAPMRAHDDICILRLSAIGDVTHVLPLVANLQRASPASRITWVIGALEYKLLRGLPGVEFIVFDKHGGWRELLKLRRRLARRVFDVLLHLQVSLRANLVSGCIRARQRIGFDRQRSRDLHGLFINQRIANKPGQHVLDGFASFLDPLGLPSADPEWQIPLGQEDLAFARRQLQPGRPVLVINPCSSHRLRNWCPTRYAAVADHAITRHLFQVILTGGPARHEQELGRQIASMMGQPVLNLIGRDTLKQGAALLAAADLVIAPDTGPAHIASAMGTPIIGLYAATNPRRSGPYRSLDWCVDKYDQAARKYRHQPASELKWGTKLEYPGVMDLIEVGEVTERIDQWYQSNNPDRTFPLPAPSPAPD